MIICGRHEFEKKKPQLGKVVWVSMEVYQKQCANAPLQPPTPPFFPLATPFVIRNLLLFGLFSRLLFQI